MEIRAELSDRSAVAGACGIDGGIPPKATARLFQVSVSYIYKAMAQRAATGETEASAQRNRQTLKLEHLHAAIAAEVAARLDVKVGGGHKSRTGATSPRGAPLGAPGKVP